MTVSSSGASTVSPRTIVPMTIPRGSAKSSIRFPTTGDDSTATASIISALPLHIEWTETICPFLICCKMLDTVISLGLTVTSMPSDDVSGEYDAELLISVTTLWQPNLLARSDDRIFTSSSLETAITVSAVATLASSNISCDNALPLITVVRVRRSATCSARFLSSSISLTFKSALSFSKCSARNSPILPPPIMIMRLASRSSWPNIAIALCTLCVSQAKYSSSSSRSSTSSPATMKFSLRSRPSMETSASESLFCTRCRGILTIGQSSVQRMPITFTLPSASGIVSTAPGTCRRCITALATSISGEMIKSIGRWSCL